MKVLAHRAPYPIHVPDEGLLMSSATFQVGTEGVWEIEATPMGVVIRRHRVQEFAPHGKRQLADILLSGAGWSEVEKKEPPKAVVEAMRKKGTA